MSSRRVTRSLEIDVLDERKPTRRECELVIDVRAVWSLTTRSVDPNRAQKCIGV